MDRVTHAKSEVEKRRNGKREMICTDGVRDNESMKLELRNISTTL